MKTFFELRENLTRPPINPGNISYRKRELGKAGYTTAAKPVKGSSEKMGFAYRKKKYQDPFAQERKLRDISRTISRSRYRTGYRQQ